MTIRKIKEDILSSFTKTSHIAPLVILRIAFGAIMFISTVRFMLKGWITEYYVKPIFHFTFYGFEWVHPFGETGMYIIFALMAVASLFIMLGFFYRISSLTFLVSFLYVELLDKTYYLNHYYFVSLIAFLLALVPAHRFFSLDIRRNPSLEVTHVPAWTISIFKLQLILVYFFAGISKINHDWLIEALPLRIWLPASEHLPIVGPWLRPIWVAYLFSWFGMIYDLSIGFFLLNKKTRVVAYITVVIFHLLTALLFNIGMFPYIMILVTIIFFSEDFHKSLTEKLRSLFGSPKIKQKDFTLIFSKQASSILKCLLVSYFVLQLLVPLRYLIYQGELFWTEQGYRFSWRVMLMEKSGQSFFYVKDPATNNKVEIINSTYLTSFQDRMMATQPDMILQYAHFLNEQFKKEGISDPVITVQSYVTLNGRGSQLYIDSTVDLSLEKESFHSKQWILDRHN